MALEMDQALSMSLDEYIAKSKNSAGAAASGVGRLSQSNKTNGANETQQVTSRKRSYGSGNTTCNGYSDLDVNDEEEDDASDLLWRGPSSTENVLEFAQDNREDDDVTIIIDDTDESIRIEDDQTNGFDLRQKISGNLPPLNSVQWRIMYPNNNPDRSPGMPPLVPQSLLTSKMKPSRQNRPRHRWGGNSNAQLGNGNGGGQFNNRKNNHYNNNNNNGFKNRNMNNNNPSNNFNNRNRHFNNNNNNNNNLNGHSNNQGLPVNMLNQSLQCLLKRSNGLGGPASGVEGLQVDCESATISLEPSAPNMQFRTDRPTPSALTAKATATLNLTNGHAGVGALGQITNNVDLNGVVNNLGPAAASNDNLSLCSLLGINEHFTAAEVPMLATKFMNFMRNGAMASMPTTTHKPVYDMKIQNEIHQLQKKPLVYKSGSGEVISSDGEGINCKIQPRTSGVSMNYRFG